MHSISYKKQILYKHIQLKKSTSSMIEVLQDVRFNLNGFGLHRWLSDFFTFSAILEVKGMGHSIKTIVTIAIYLLTKYVKLLNI